MSSTSAPSPDRPGAELPKNCRDFLDYLSTEKGYSPATVKAYALDLEQFEAGLARVKKSLSRPGAVKKADVRTYLADMHRDRISKSSMARKLSSIRTFFRYMIRQGRAEANPAAQVRNPKQDKRHPRTMNVDQALHLMEAAVAPDPEGLRDLALAELLYGTGLRISEALNLDLDDVDPASGIVRVMGKGSKERVTPVSDAALMRLGRWIEQRNAFSPGPRRTGSVSRGARQAAGPPPSPAHPLPPGDCGGAARGRASPHAPPQLRLAHAPGRGRSAQRAGASGTRAAVHHPAVHPPGFAADHAHLRQGPPPVRGQAEHQVLTVQGQGSPVDKRLVSTNDHD